MARQQQQQQPEAEGGSRIRIDVMKGTRVVNYDEAVCKLKRNNRPSRSRSEAAHTFLLDLPPTAYTSSQEKRANKSMKAQERETHKHCWRVAEGNQWQA